MNLLKRQMFFSGSALLCILICSIPCSAMIDGHYQKAERLLVLTELPVNLEQLSAIAITIQMEEEPKLKKYEKIFNEYVSKYVSWEVLKDDFVDVYMETFSESELDQLIEFYSSPLGKKSIQLAPSLMNQTSFIVQQAFINNERRLEKMIKEYDRKSRKAAKSKK
ncbi:DUF2059 domain-containing protein [Desulfosediminicola flagellatus]|uniref:DUF2059 domain-containing protein n=1 Tax=Desulfosediminicola flagellatus TaxID=2569541 RepID=UPI0010AC5EAA|nr:DUF2059 domain-containing protein [Desulfosediminicola flagellatus]